MSDLFPVVFRSFGGWSYVRMWHDGSPPPPLEPPVTACHSEGGKKREKFGNRP
jgi:hypothetical protein